jgi:Sec-independent protein translocase protein TatA
VGFGIEILIVLGFGLLILGPKQMHTLLAHVVRAKNELENATRRLRSQLAAELNAAPGSDRSDCSHVLVGDCELCSTPKSALQSRELAEDVLIEI